MQDESPVIADRAATLTSHATADFATHTADDATSHTADVPTHAQPNAFAQEGTGSVLSDASANQYSLAGEMGPSVQSPSIGMCLLTLTVLPVLFGTLCLTVTAIQI